MRNVLGIADADHEQTSLEGTHLVISKLACSLESTSQEVQVVSGTLAHRAYGASTVMEQFNCSYGLNPAYRAQLERSAMCISGVDAAGEARIIELPGHPFFLGTLYLPQLSSRRGAPHPLIAAYLRAAQRQRTLSGKLTN